MVKEFIVNFDAGYAEKPGIDEAAKVVWPAEEGGPDILLPKARVYAAKRRITALMDQVGVDDGERSIYGTIAGNMITRSGEQFVGDFRVVGDALIDLGVEKTLINPAGLRLDKRALLGLDATGVTTQFKDFDWSCPVLGSFDLKACADGLTVRPKTIDLKTNGSVRTLKFVEGKESHPAEGPVEGAQQWKVVFDRPHDRTPRWCTDSLSSTGALLFDVVQDGGWESSSPLWIKTTEGCLQVTHKELEVRYGVLNESRSIDVTEWFHARNEEVQRSLLPPGARVRLLLDHCSGIILELSREGADPFGASLTIQAPAFVILLEGVSSHPHDMVDSSQPPSASMFSAGPLLHVVSAPLFQAHRGQPDEVLQWEITTDGSGHVQLSTDRKTTDKEAFFRFYRPNSDWVRPPEAAANAENSEMSAMRVLLPHEPRSEVRTVLTLMEQGLVLDGFSGPEPAIKLEMDKKSAVALGPLAKFTVGKTKDHPVSLDLELSTAGETVSLSQQPAILRPGYRSMADAQLSPAPFAATYVYAGEAPLKALDEVRCIYTQAMSDEKTIWALRAKDGVPQIRRDDFSKFFARLGWWDTHRFIRRQVPGAGPWLEFQITDADQYKWQLTHWLRLSDASLARYEGSVVPVMLADADLEANVPEPMIKLASSLSQEEAHGLGHMTLIEHYVEHAVPNGVSTFTLWLDGIEVTVSQPDFTVVGRLVITFAAPNPSPAIPPIALADDVTVNRLNRLFLELEREGSGFRVRRGMLGWNAERVFGLDCSKDEKEAAHDFHFTEYYERVEGGLSRRVELSGQALGPRIATLSGVDDKVSGEYRTSVYFWASVLMDGSEPRYMRVICVHQLTCAGVTFKPAWAVQDARVKDNILDLSADIALVDATGDSEGDPQSALDVWQPWRRKLFSVNINSVDERVSPLFFLQIRHGPGASFAVMRDKTKERGFTLHFDWERCNKAITPWFSDESISRRDQTTWLLPQTSSQSKHDLLRTVGQGEAGGPEMVVRLFVLNNNSDIPTPGNLRACTLVGEEVSRSADAAEPVEPQGGIPQWVPSPMLDVGTTAPAATPAAEPANQVSVWLFDPWPRVVVQFDGTDDAAISRTVARSALARIGWTREAVLEMTIADVKTWSVVDSPLLNRDADINWFGWPLAEGAQKPNQGPLAQTTQVVHVPETGRPRVGVQVTFEHEVDAQGKYRIPTVYLPQMIAAGSSGVRFHDIQFRSRGLRTGVPHQVVTYGTKVNAGPSVEMVAKSSMSTDAEPLADLTSVEDGDGGGIEFSWGSGSGDLADVKLLNTLKFEEGVHLELGSSKFWTHVVFLAMPPGLQVHVGLGSAAAWKDIVKGVPIDMIEPELTENVMDVRLPSGLWSAIHIVLQVVKDAKVTESLTRSYFVNASGAQSVAGLFRNGELVAFGDEPMRFSPSGEGTWSHRSIMAMRGVSRTDEIYVASMNPFGVITRHVLENVG